MYNQQKTTLYRGVNYTVTTYRQTNYDPMTTKVWIDYNMNAQFTDAGETIINQVRAYNISTSQTFRIPDANPTGNTRMRVGIGYDITTVTPDYAQIGCFEDYGINIGKDLIAPVVTLNGSAVHKMQVGKSFVDPGVVAIDNLEGNITTSGRLVRTGYVDTAKVGYYTLIYTATDLYGNVSIPVTRVVQVEVNQTGPTLTLNGADTMMVGVKTAFTDPGAVAVDNIGANISGLIVRTGTLDVNTLGNYTLTYKVTDAFGFTSQKIRTVMVKDTSKPVIQSLSGNSTIRWQIGTAYVDQVMVTDNYWSNLVATPTGTINVNVMGTYTLTYNVNDGSGNAATPYMLVVKIDDIEAPVLKLNGQSDMTVDVKTVFVDPGYTVSDNYYSTGSLNVTKTPANGPNMNTLNNTTINYTACDPSNNCTSLTRTVHVVDKIAPVVKLVGANPYYHPRFQQYVDPGVILTDNYYTDASMRASTYFNPNYSSVSNDAPGIYFVTFKLTDPSGNVGKTVTRTVIVNEESFSGIANANASSTIKLYPNPNNGKFTIDAEGTEISSVKVYNIIGTLVKEISNRDNSKTIEIDMTGVSEGVYIVRTEGQGKIATQKITIVK